MKYEKHNNSILKIVSSAVVFAVAVMIIMPFFIPNASGGITVARGQMIRAAVGPEDMYATSFRVGDYGSGYSENDGLSPIKRFFSFYSYDNVLKSREHIFDSAAGSFALIAVADDNYYYSSDWQNDFGGWADLEPHGSASVRAGNYHIEITVDFSLEDAEELIEVVKSCGYFAFPAYLDSGYRVRIGQYFSLSEADADIVTVSDAVNNTVAELTSSSDDVSSEPSSLADESSSVSSVSDDSLLSSESDVTISVPSEETSDSQSSSDEVTSQTISDTSSEAMSDASMASSEVDNEAYSSAADSRTDTTSVSSESLASETTSPRFLDLTFGTAGGTDTGITVLEERSGELLFEFDCPGKWLCAVPSPDAAVYHRVNSMNYPTEALRNFGKYYNGSLEIIRHPELDYAFSTVNLVDLDSYIKSVLMGEMGNTTNTSLYEAYRTQAIVARTYALRKILYSNSHGSDTVYGYDICDSSHCQVYGGNTINATSVVSQAVETTNGMVITYKSSGGNDILIEAVYSASNGGFTLSNYQYWGTAQTSYLKQVEDSYENLDTARNGRWGSEFTPENLGKYFNYLRTNAYDYFYKLRVYNGEGFITGSAYNNAVRMTEPVGDIVKFYAEVTTPLGDIPMKLVFEDEYGTKFYLQYGGNIKSVMSARSDFGLDGFSSAMLKSPNFHIYYRFDGIYASDMTENSEFKGRLDETYIQTADGIKTVGGYPDSVKMLSASGTVSLPSQNYMYIIKGTGWGHGVGMSQEGSFGRSKAGFTAEEIVHHYYTDVDIITVTEQ